MPVVSIIIPCYQQAHYLPVTLASVQSQSLQDWECLIVDDGSLDETDAIAASWALQDGRFRYLHKENGGLSSARNYGLCHAKGRYIQFLDSDDVILTSKLDIQVRQLLDCPSPRSVAICDYKRGGDKDIYAPFDEPGCYLPPILGDAPSVYELAADWETRLSIPPHCFLFDRVFFDEGIGFDESLANHEDWDCWMQIFGRCEAVRYCPEKLAIYRYHHESMCRNLEKMHEGYLQAIDKHLANPSSGRVLKTILRVKRAEIDFLYKYQIHMAQKNEEISTIYNSYSWMITNPLRKINDLARLKTKKMPGD